MKQTVYFLCGRPYLEVHTDELGTDAFLCQDPNKTQDPVQVQEIHSTIKDKEEGEPLIRNNQPEY